MPSPKPFLALLHGWGMNARVFDELAVLLAAAFEVRAFDLPGHGGRDAVADNTLRGWADDLAQQLPEGATLLGWSLGGQVAMRAALDHPHKIARLVLLASTPKFVAAEDWPHGMAPAALEDFGAALLAEPEMTLLRFLSLQTRGMPGQKTLLQRLRQTLLAAPAASSEALAGGLAMLRDTDLRAELPQLAQPVLVLHGALDTLTPAAAGAWLAEALPRAQHIAFCRAAHAPHLSHAEEVAAAIGRFAHG
ncbi:pimeloyl-ACP methyl ester esterase BioH [Thiobacillus sp. 65-1402]|uniref:pimeloyl-ACP methyl ester esterase BioH n=1 Tax=Thiobacillus sp. 65-1402 TaxID=1895861 RepID=UPI00095BAF39|nr:pimeloyl-ACP methyl ester esterase BioH [Thiobacillus sp. 65-1402]OJW90252.1 MAG: pimeloyl-[acyl-carrier protein] methyl ester esterase [Thiobacillus sp. 65-1402]